MTQEETEAALQRVQVQLRSLSSERRETGVAALLALKKALQVDPDKKLSFPRELTFDTAFTRLYQIADEWPAQDVDNRNAVNVAVTILRAALDEQSKPPRARNSALKPERLVAAMGRRTLMTGIIAGAIAGTLATEAMDNVLQTPSDGHLTDDEVMLGMHRLEMETVREDLKKRLIDRKKLVAQGQKNPEGPYDIFQGVDSLFDLLRDIRPNGDMGNRYENDEQREFMPVLARAIEEGASSLIIAMVRAYPRFVTEKLISAGWESGTRTAVYTLPEYMKKNYGRRVRPDIPLKDMPPGITAVQGQSR